MLFVIFSGVFIFGGGGVQNFPEKWGYLHGEATRLLGGFGGMHPRENLKKWYNLVRFRGYFVKILSKINLKNSHFLYKNNR